MDFIYTSNEEVKEKLIKQGFEFMKEQVFHNKIHYVFLNNQAKLIVFMQHENDFFISDKFFI